MKKSAFEFLSESLSEIKRLGSILCGDTLSGGDTWQKVAFTQAGELRWYARLLERVAAGKEGGGVVFPSWDAEGVDGDGGGVFTEMEAVPMPPESVAGVPKSGVMPAWAVSASELQRSYSNAKAALAAAAIALREGADTLAMYGSETGKPMTCLAVEARLRTVADLATATIEGAARKS